MTVACGIRFNRADLLVLADSNDALVRPGDVVVVRSVLPSASPSAAGEGPEERLATVVISSEQLVAGELPERLEARIERVATEADLVSFGRIAAGRLLALRSAAGAPDNAPSDAWLTPDGGRLHLLFPDSDGADWRLVAFDLAAILGLPVEVHLGRSFADSICATGPLSVGVPAASPRGQGEHRELRLGTGISAQPGSDILGAEEVVRTAGEFIERIFGPGSGGGVPRSGL